MALGHWAKSYLNEGKANNGGGGSGGGSSVLVVPMTGDADDGFTATKTAAEIMAADSVVFVSESTEGLAKYPMISGMEIEGEYYFTIYATPVITLECYKPDAYPSSNGK